MAMVGHRTGAIYRRYAIVDEVMLREAVDKLARATCHEGRPASRDWTVRESSADAPETREET
jgi:hypothetical protein